MEIVRRCEEAGVDAFEVNFSCPHGMPERKMGMAMGQCPELLEVPPWSIGAHRSRSNLKAHLQRQPAVLLSLHKLSSK